MIEVVAGIIYKNDKFFSARLSTEGLPERLQQLTTRGYRLRSTALKTLYSHLSMTLRLWMQNFLKEISLLS